MCANGVPHELIIGIFEDAIADIKGFKDRVWNNAVTENDQQLIALCNDVSRQCYSLRSIRLWAMTELDSYSSLWLNSSNLASTKIPCF